MRTYNVDQTKNLRCLNPEGKNNGDDDGDENGNDDNGDDGAW